ncbi:hypothetical protein [Rhizobium sp. No.120]
MTPTPEMIEAAKQAYWKHYGKMHDDNVVFEKTIAAALALIPGETLPAAVKEIDRQKAADAAVKANHAYGQWMPERWLHLFLDAYEGKL